MASKTDIANLTLAHLELDGIDNLDGSDEFAAKQLRKVWDLARDVALARHPWNFATTWWRDLSAIDSTLNPSPEHANAFLKPPDCLRVLKLGTARRGEPFVIAEGYICTDADAPLTIRGIKRITDPGRYSIWFVNYFSLYLAWAVGKSLNASEALRKRALDDAAMVLSEARSLDGQEGEVPDLFGDTFLEAREGGDWFA